MYNYSNELVESVQEVFKTMMNMDVQFLPFVHAIPWATENQYTSMVGLAGQESGLIYIHCKEDFALKSTATMLGIDVGDDKASVIDALGEIANMVGGNFKNKVKEYKDYKLSLPSVVVGTDFTTHAPGGDEGKILGFKHENYMFVVQICLKK